MKKLPNSSSYQKIEIQFLPLKSDIYKKNPINVNKKQVVYSEFIIVVLLHLFVIIWYLPSLPHHKLQEGRNSISHVSQCLELCQTYKSLTFVQ